MSTAEQRKPVNRPGVTHSKYGAMLSTTDSNADIIHLKRASTMGGKVRKPSMPALPPFKEDDLDR